MGFASQSGHFGMKTQAAKGTFEDPGGAAPNEGIFMRTRGGSIGTSRELLVPDAEIGGTRDVTDAFLGPVSYAGEIEFYSRMESLATLFKWVSGDHATTTTGTTRGVDLVGTHVITPGEVLPWGSVEENIGGTMETLRYTDAQCNSLSLEGSPDGYFMGSANILALDALATDGVNFTKTTVPEWDATPMMVGTSMIITIDGLSTYCVRDWSMEFTNNMEDDAFCLGSPTLEYLTPKRRELTMSMTIRPDDNILWREAVFGAAAATAPLSGAAVRKAIKVDVETYEPVGSGVLDKYRFTMDVPFANIQPFELEPSGDDVIEWDVEVQAIKPDPLQPLYTATIVNDLDEIR